MEKFEREQIEREYLSNDMRKLNKICKFLILRKNVPQMYEDDLYSIARITFVESLKTFDCSKKCKFQTYFIGNAWRAFYDWTRDNTRWKRCNLQTDKDGKIARDEKNNPIIIPDISIDAPTEDGVDLSERVASSFNIEDSTISQMDGAISDNAQKYLRSLSNTQRQIAKFLMDGCSPFEIREKLNLTEKQYADHLKDMKAFEKSRILKQVDYVQKEEDKLMQTQTSEKSKERQYSISSLIKKIDGYTFRFDHPTQRESGRWNSKMKGNLISDVLQNNPLPHLVFAEQIIDGVAVTWNLDGKQKSTNVYDYYNDGFKVCKNVRRWNIEYQSMVKDENGKVVISENGLPQIEQKTFDIRGKKFSELPEELQERFCDYTFQCTQYLNCSDEDIEYHICRYNEGKPLNGSEKGMGEIGTKYASIVKEIAAMPFFTDRGGYKMAEFKNGTVNRVVVESIMSINFLDDWKKQQEEMCSFMKENATEEKFDNFTDLVERMENIITDDVSEMFTSKDSFIYFGLFARFVESGLNDEKFIEFMAEFSQSLHSKEIDGITFDDLNGKSTKDKNVVIGKINHLEKLMNEYLHIDEKLGSEEDNQEISVIEFVRKHVFNDVEADDIELYKNILDDCVKVTSPIYKKDNFPSLIALIAYGCVNDRDLEVEKILNDYQMRNSLYIKDQEKNYLHMITELNRIAA